MGAEEASEALFEAIQDRATDASASDLKTLAEAYACIVHGPQGGAKHEESETRTTADNHSTTHAGEARARPAGFTG